MLKLLIALLPVAIGGCLQSGTSVEADAGVDATSRDATTDGDGAGGWDVYFPAPREGGILPDGATYGVLSDGTRVACCPIGTPNVCGGGEKGAGGTPDDAMPKQCGRFAPDEQCSLAYDDNGCPYLFLYANCGPRH